MGNKQKFVEFVTEWCEDDSHGYSQVNRWGPDCDCSSLMYMAARATLRKQGLLARLAKSGINVAPQDRKSVV